MPYLSGPPEWTAPAPAAPDLLSRYGEGVANLLPEVGRAGQNLLDTLGFSEETETPQPLKDFFDIPAPTNWKETGVDIAAGLTKAIPLIASGELAGAGVAELGGFTEGSMGARALKLAGGFGAQGAVESPERGAAGATTGAVMGIAEKLPARYRVPLSALLGLGTYADVRQAGGTETQALTQGTINAVLPSVSAKVEAFLKGRRAGSGNSLIDEKMQETMNPAAAEVTPNALQELVFKRADEQSRGGADFRGAPAKGPTLAEQIARFDREDAEELATLQRPAAPAPTEPVPPKPAAEVVPPAPDIAVPPSGVSIERPEIQVTTNREINPTRQLKLKTILHPDDSEMAQKAAAKLSLEFQGVMGEGDNRFLEFKIPEDAKSPAAGANMSVPMGETMKDLRNRVAFKNEQFAAGSNEELQAVNKKYPKYSGYEEPVIAPTTTAAAEPVIATLQPETDPVAAAVPSAITPAKESRIDTLRRLQSAAKEREPIPAAPAPPPSPLSEGGVAPVFTKGDTVFHDIGDGPEMAKVVSINKDGTTKVRMVHDSSEWDVHQDNLSNKMPGQDLDQVIKYHGSMEDLAALEEQNNTKAAASGMKLKLRPNEYGGIDPELAVALGRYVASPVIGSVIGAATADKDERLQRAMLGAIGGLAVGHFGPAALKFLADIHPDIGKAGSLPEKLKEILKGVGDVARGTVMDKDLAAAAIQSGQASGAARFARWMEKRWGRDPDVVRVMQKAEGMAQLFHGQNLEEAIKFVSKDPSYQDAGVRKALLDYWTGKVPLDSLKQSLGNNQALVNQAVLASASEQALQDSIVRSMPKDHPLAKEITNSKGKYLTQIYDFYTNKDFWPSDEAIAKAAKDMDDRFGSNIEVKVNRINQFLRDEKALMTDYKSGKRQLGEAFGTILSREKEVPDSWKEMLGPIDDPVHRMAATGMKLVVGSRTAELYDAIAEGVSDRTGLKFSYSGDELKQTMDNVRDKLGAAKTPKEIATLQQQLTALKGYMPLEWDTKYGKLRGQWIDHNFHDQILTADSLTENFNSKMAQGLANVTNMVKVGHTVLSPFQFVRQVYSMPFLGVLSGTTPADWLRVAKPLMRMAMGKATEADTTWAERLRKNGVMYGDIMSGQFFKDMKPMAGSTLDTLAGKTGAKELYLKWSEFFRMPDLVTRVAKFERSERLALAAGHSAEDAENIGINDANRYALNYAAVPRGVTRYRQMPFVNQYLSWAYDITRITKNLLEDAKNGDVSAAVRLGTVAGAPFVLAAMARQFNLNDKDRADWDKANALLPAYNRQNFKVVWGRDAKTGRFSYTDITPLVIQDNLLKMFRGAIHRDAAVVGSANPILGWENTPLFNVARNQSAGEDLHTGREFSQSSVGANLWDRFNSARRDIAPTLFGGTDLDKLAAALAPNAEGGMGITNTRTGQKTSIGQFVVSYITGTKSYSLDLNTSQQRYLQDVTKQIRNEIANYATIRNSDVSAEYKRAAVMRIQQRVLNLKEEARSRLGLDSQ